MKGNESNFNQTSFEAERSVPWYITTILLILISILAILGNLMVLAATWIERNLHQPSKYFIACLAVADLLVGVCSNPLMLYQHLSHYGITSLDLCRFHIWIDIFAEAASIFTLAFISFDRYLKIRKPLQYNLLMTNSKSLIVICTIWLASTSLATFGMFPYVGSAGIYIASDGCRSENIVFYTFSAVFGFFLPAFMTLVMYVRIFFIAHKRRKMAQNRDLGQIHEVRNQRLTTFYQDLKNIRMLAIVIGAFICCWGPFFILLTVSLHYPAFATKYDLGNDTVTFITIRILPPLNSVCNPIIYAYFDEKYKEAFKRLFMRVMCKSTSSVI